MQSIHGKGMGSLVHERATSDEVAVDGAGFVVLDFTSPWPEAKDQGTWDDVVYLGRPQRNRVR